MAVPKAETVLTRSCIAWVGKNRGRAWHVNGSILQPTGEPDIDGYIWSFVLDRYIHLKIEIKTPTGVTSAKQDLRLAEYAQAGYCTGVATNLTEFIQVIRDYENEQRNAGIDTGETL
jgi:hypothetical protein